MKKFSLYIAILASAVTLVSCKPVSHLQKDARYMQIRFKPLSRNDMTLVGNLSAEVTITGKGSIMDKSFANNLKQGLNRVQRSEMLYFSPGQGEVITGDLFTESLEFAQTGLTSSGKRKSLLEMFFPRVAAAKAAAAPIRPLDFAFYALIEKYPDVDYFINVRFDKKHVLSGSKWTETVIVKADGVKLKTD